MPLVYIFIKLSMLPALLAIAWDVAVITKQDIEFLRNGNVVGVAHGYLKDLTVGAYDPVRGYLYVSDASHVNTSIFRVNRQSVGDDVDPSAITFQPVISKQASVQGIVFDPITSTLFWTTGTGQTILKYTVPDTDHAVSAPQHPGRVVHAFEDGSRPRGITVDSCRETIYWTNIKPLNATIERSKFDGSERTVVVPSSRNDHFRLFQPYGLIVDPRFDHLYWCDAVEGNEFQIVRSNLDGSEPRIIIKHSGPEPYGLTIADDRLYWTDQHGGLYSLPLNSSDQQAESTLIKKFGASLELDGVISNTLYLNLKTDRCRGMESIKTQIEHLYKEELPSFSPSQRIDPGPTNDYCDGKQPFCLNGGKVINGFCTCPLGFTGSRCEYSVCNNYCLNGTCEIDPSGLPSCKCSPGWSGERCQTNRCRDVCFNGGRCVVGKNDEEPFCECGFGFSGRRCELQTDMVEKLCTVYCKTRDVAKAHQRSLSDETIHDFKSIMDSLSEKSLRICSCPENQSLPISESAEVSNSEDYGTSNASVDEHNSVVLVIVLAVSCVLLGALVLVLSGKVFKLRKRPRIRKRIVVNRPSVPFCRPPAVARDQCEITIENCCNMNICETPCFEPEFRSSKPTFSNKTKSEDKKGLITSMYSNSSLDDENQ